LIKQILSKVPVERFRPTAIAAAGWLCAEFFQDKQFYTIANKQLVTKCKTLIVVMRRGKVIFPTKKGREIPAL
jgi:hypothetical protein